jgi:dTDP-4-dehydrorhamnose 3,5-epimerase
MNTSSFNSEELNLPGVTHITPKIFTDERGLAMNAYVAKEFIDLGIMAQFVQDFVSFSKKNVIRGMHFQREPYAQDKLVRCASGRILDVAVDFDPTSKTFGTCASVELDATKGDMLFVPGKYAHGFCVLSDEGALVEYKIANDYNPDSASGVRWDDPSLKITWPVQNPILSEKDKSWPLIQS